MVLEHLPSYGNTNWIKIFDIMETLIIFAGTMDKFVSAESVFEWRRERERERERERKMPQQQNQSRVRKKD